MTIEQKQLKKRVLKLIDIIEENTAIGQGVATCFFMPRDYEVFLRENGILRRPVIEGITESLFRSRVTPSNIFRMMVITEYCRQKGVKL